MKVQKRPEKTNPYVNHCLTHLPPMPIPEAEESKSEIGEKKKLGEKGGRKGVQVGKKGEKGDTAKSQARSEAAQKGWERKKSLEKAMVMLDSESDDEKGKKKKTQKRK
jgi:hypothetical protein